MADEHTTSSAATVRAARMRAAERALFERLRAGMQTQPFRTRTAVDVGRWFVRGRVWIFVLPGELVQFASGRRPFVARVPRPRLTGSAYNHVTGELVLPAAAEPAVRRLRLSPVAGLHVLEQLSRSDEAKTH
jgi:hypothetical protein